MGFLNGDLYRTNLGSREISLRRSLSEVEGIGFIHDNTAFGYTRLPGQKQKFNLFYKQLNLEVSRLLHKIVV